MGRDIKSTLRQMYRQVPPLPDKASVGQLHCQVQSVKAKLPMETSMTRFIYTQLRFVNLKVWWAQFGIMVVYIIVMVFLEAYNEAALLLVPIGPLVVLASIGELSRSYRYRMLDIEYPTRYSLHRILLARLIIIVGIDVIVMTGLMYITTWQVFISVEGLILYGLVPCFISIFGALCMINRWGNYQVHNYISVFCCFVSIMGTISVFCFTAWYEASAHGVWGAILIITFIGILNESKRMLSVRTDYEFAGINE